MTTTPLFMNNSTSLTAHTPEQLTKQQLGWLCTNTNFPKFHPVKCCCIPSNGEDGACETCNAKYEEEKSQGPNGIGLNHVLASKQRNAVLANEGDLTYKFNLQWWTDYTPDQLWRVWNLAVMGGRCKYAEEPKTKSKGVDKTEAEKADKTESVEDVNEIDLSGLQISESDPPISPTVDAECLDSYELVSCDPEWDDECLWEEQGHQEYGDYTWDEKEDADSSWEEVDAEYHSCEDENIDCSWEDEQEFGDSWKEKKIDDSSWEEEADDDSGWEKVTESKSWKTKRLEGDFDDY